MSRVAKVYFIKLQFQQAHRLNTGSSLLTHDKSPAVKLLTDAAALLLEVDVRANAARSHVTLDVARRVYGGDATTRLLTRHVPLVILCGSTRGQLELDTFAC